MVNGRLDAAWAMAGTIAAAAANCMILAGPHEHGSWRPGDFDPRHQEREEAEQPVGLTPLDAVFGRTK